MSKLYWQRLLSRRQFFIGGISLTTAIATLFLSNFQVLSYLIHPFKSNANKLADKSRKFGVVGKKSLQHRARSKGLIYGAFPEADNYKFDRDPEFKSKFARECTMMTVGTFWGNHRPKPDTFDFTSSDYFVKFGTENKLLMHGGPLVWHEFVPEWLEATVNEDNAKRILTNHIETIVKRYAGKIQSWDVVNEGVDIGKGQRADGMRNSVWMKSLGFDYMDIAFRAAAKADPRAKLVYNDFGVEYDRPGYDARREAVLTILQRLKSKGTPIHALGIQSHLFGDRHPFAPSKFREFLKNVASLGLKIMITELDVEDRKLPKDITQRDRLVAAAYEDYLSIALAQKAVISVTSWGLSDRYTWLSGRDLRDDKAEKRPLPFDRNLRPKLAWNALARAFDRAPKR